MATLLVSAFFSIAVFSSINVQAQNLQPLSDADAHVNTPSSVSHFDYVGCLGSDTLSLDDEDATTFTPVEEWEFMNINQCISDCYHAAYAAVNNQTCYCSSSSAALDGLKLLDQSQCTIPCPGNIEQTCGGTLPSNSDSDDNTVLLFSVYNNAPYYTHPDPTTTTVTNDDHDDPNSQPHRHFDLVRPRGIPLPNPPPPPPPNTPPQSIFPTPISTTYTDICTPSLCPSAYPSEYATTITALVTRTSPESVPTVPMSRKNVQYTSTNDEGRLMAMATAVLVPDEGEIEVMAEEVRAWRDEWVQQQNGDREDEQETVLDDANGVEDEAEGSASGGKGEDVPVTGTDADGNDNEHRLDVGDEAAEDGDISQIKRRDDTSSHAAYRRNDDEDHFAGIGGLGNVQVMPAEGYWKKE